MILSEAGIDWPDVGRLASERSGWKKLMKERMDHLNAYERQLAHWYVWRDGKERLVRNERRVNEDLRCRYEGCERLCRSRAGLVRHESMMHRRLEGIVRFASDDCGLEVATKGAFVGHRRTSGAGGGWGQAEGVWGVRSSGIICVQSCRARGRGAEAVGDGGEGGVGEGKDGGGRVAGVGGGGGGADGVGRVGVDVGGGVGRRVSCQYCGWVVTVRNMARHLRQSCRVWDPGGGGRPLSEESDQKGKGKTSRYSKTYSNK